MNGPSIYAPDYLRLKEDKQLHLIADMIESQINRNIAYRHRVDRVIKAAQELISNEGDFTEGNKY